MSYSEEAQYLEDRILLPLQRAINLVRQLGQVEITAGQKQDALRALDMQLQAATNKHTELQGSIDRLRASHTEQRLELQALLQEDRRTREQERVEHLKVQEQRKEEVREEKAKLDRIKQERERAEQQLDALKADLSKRLQSLQGLAS